MLGSSRCRTCVRSGSRRGGGPRAGHLARRSPPPVEHGCGQRHLLAMLCLTPMLRKVPVADPMCNTLPIVIMGHSHNVHFVYDALQPGRRCAGQTSVSGQVID